MNDIQFNCPHCRQSMSVAAASAGATVACPHCVQTISVPRLRPPPPLRANLRRLAILGVVALLLLATGLLLRQKHERVGNPAQTVAFSDPHLQAAVQSALGLSSGPITVAEMLTLTNLTASGDHLQVITGLQYATNLASLDISQNDLADLSPLTRLEK